MRFFKIIILFQLIANINVSAQTVYTVNGSLKDSTDNPVINLRVNLITNRDTLVTHTDKQGSFKFTGLNKIRNITILVDGQAYEPLKLDYNFDAHEKIHNLKPIVLRDKPTSLKEVIIRGKPIPIIFKQDTIEFNAEAFSTSKDDLLEDLLRRLPGITIDPEGNAFYMGKELNRLRVNGKDFFSGNLADFLEQLPADILSKLQVIDDYGDEANFSGIKIGQPVKMLNLVTKNGMDNGIFGNVAANLGSNKQYGLSANANYWKSIKQISLGVVTNKTDNISGKINSNSIAASYRDVFMHKLTLSVNYSYTNNINSVILNSFSQNVINTAKIYNEVNNETSGKTNNHILKFDLQYRPNQNNFWSLSPSLSFTNEQTKNQLTSFQTGSIRQDLYQNNETITILPLLSGSISFMHHFAKLGRNITINYQLTHKNNEQQNYSIDSIKYYGTNNTVSTDSLLNRLIDNNNRETVSDVRLTYTEPLNLRSSIDIIASASQKIQKNNLSTKGSTPNGYKVIDSVSNLYESRFTSFLLNLAYRYNNKKLRLTAGTSYQPSILIGNNSQSLNNETSKLKDFSFAPLLNILYLISQRNTFTLNYTSNNSPPDYNQLNPVKNTENIQNTIVGNPNLKPSFSQQLNIEFGHSSQNGSFFNLNGGASTTKNKVVTNTLLLPDTLNSFKQETHFLNANGTYSFHVGYYLSFPVLALDSQKYKLNLIGNANIDQNSYYGDDILSKSQNLILNQSISFTVKQKQLDLSLSSTYSQNTNRVYDGTGINTSFRSIQLTLNANYVITKNLSIDVNNSKTFNSGITNMLSTNPLIINISAKQTLFKKKVGSIKIQAFDLFNQTNNLMRTTNANTITDSRANYISRYFKLTFAMRLSQFGGKH